MDREMETPSWSPYFLHLFINLDTVLWKKIWIHSLLSSSHLVESPILQDEIKRKNGLIQQRLCIKFFSTLSSGLSTKWLELKKEWIHSFFQRTWCTLFGGFLVHIRLLLVKSIKPYDTDLILALLTVLISKIRGFKSQ